MNYQILNINIKKIYVFVKPINISKHTLKKSNNFLKCQYEEGKKKSFQVVIIY